MLNLLEIQITYPQCYSFCFCRSRPRSLTNRSISPKHPKNHQLKRSKSSQRSTDHEFYFSSSSRESFPHGHLNDRGGGSARGVAIRSRACYSQDGGSSRDLLSTSCDPNMLRCAKNELLPPENTNNGTGGPYRKLSLTPDLPRLERRSMLNNHPLQKHTQKLSTSEESDLVESDLNINHVTTASTNQNDHAVIATAVSNKGAYTRSNSYEGNRRVVDTTPSNSSSASLKSKSSGTSGSKVRIVDPSENSLTSLSTSSSGGSGGSKPPKPYVSIFNSDPTDLAVFDQAERKCNSDPENVTETDKLPELGAVIDKRKAFAAKKRNKNLLTPNILADIGERSDNSDQSFDHGDSGSSNHGLTSRAAADNVNRAAAENAARAAAESAASFSSNEKVTHTSSGGDTNASQGSSSPGDQASNSTAEVS